jgi:hypothetical protein
MKNTLEIKKIKTKFNHFDECRYSRHSGVQTVYTECSYVVEICR